MDRTCDRPCEPACRRGRIEKEPYDSGIVDDVRYAVPHAEVQLSLTDRKMEVVLGYRFCRGTALFEL